MNHQSLRKSFLLIWFFTCGSCAQFDHRTGFQNIESIVSDRTGMEVRWNQGTEEDLLTAQAVSRLLETELRMDEAVQIALLNNPHLQARYEALGVSQAELVQAGLLRNPVFEAEVHFEGSGIGTGTNLNLIQDFVNLFQLPTRKKIASLRFEKEQLEIVALIFDLASEVKIAYFSLQGAEEMLALRRAIVKGLQSMVEIVKRQHQAGNVTDLDVATEHSVYIKAKLDLAQAEADALQDREKLNQLMGLWGKDMLWKIPPRLPELPSEEIPLEDLEALAVTRRIELDASRKEIEMLGLTLGLTESFRLIPEFTLGVDLEGESDGSVMVGPNFDFPVPIFDQGKTHIEKAKAQLRQAQKNYYERALKIRSEVRTARNQMLSFRARTEYAKKFLIPLSQQIVRQSQLEYNAMLLSVFQLVNAKKNEIEAGSVYVESLRGYWLARAALENAVGGSLTR